MTFLAVLGDGTRVSNGMQNLYTVNTGINGLPVFRTVFSDYKEIIFFLKLYTGMNRILLETLDGTFNLVYVRGRRRICGTWKDWEYKKESTIDGLTKCIEFKDNKDESSIGAV